MVIACPIRDQNFLKFVSKYGEHEAYKIFLKEGDMPTYEDYTKQYPNKVNLRKELKIYKKEVSDLQKNMILKRLGNLNKRLGTKHSIQFNQVGQANLYTYKISENYGENPDQGKLFANPQDNQVNYNLKVVSKVQDNLQKILQWEKQVQNPPVFWEKLQRDLGIPKDQVELLKNSEGKNIEEKLVNFLANYSYIVEINTAKDSREGRGDIPYRQLDELNNGKLPDFLSTHTNFNGLLPNSVNVFVHNNKLVIWQNGDYDNLVKNIIQGESQNQHGVKFWILKNEIAQPLIDKYKADLEKEIEQDKVRKINPPNSQYYSNLTVPGGTNYTENKIETPGVEVQEKPKGITTKKGVNSVFEQNPELAQIGTPEQYSQYLDTIFPDSKVKDIVYHGTIFDFQSFSKKKLGRYTQAPSASQGFFFTNNRLVSDSYIKPERIKEQEWIHQQNKEFVERYGKLTDISKVDNAIKELKELLSFQNNNIYNLKPNSPEYYSDSEYIVFKESKDAKFNSYREEDGWKELEPQKTYRRFYDHRSNSYKFEEVSGERLKILVNKLYKSTTKKDYKFNKNYLESSLSWMEYIKDLYKQGEDLPNLPIKFQWEIAENQSYGNRELLNTYIINKYAEIGKTSYRKPSPITKYVILNLENPLIFDYEGEKYRSVSYYDKLKEANNKGNDGAILQNTYDSGFLKEDKYEADVFVVFEPEQIHILGGKQDIEGFNKWIKANSKIVRKGAITPSIKGHAQFATDNGIGWFRSDEQVEKNTAKLENSDYPVGFEDIGGKMISKGGTPTKTRRILEVQSDVFQKGRDIKSPDEVIQELQKQGKLEIKCD